MSSETRPRRRCRSARSIASARRPLRTRSPAGTSGSAELMLEHLARTLKLGLQRRVDLALLGAHDGAAARHAPLGLHLAVLDAAERADQPGDPFADELEIVRVDE